MVLFVAAARGKNEKANSCAFHRLVHVAHSGEVMRRMRVRQNKCNVHWPPTLRVYTTALHDLAIEQRYKICKNSKQNLMKQKENL